MRPAHRRLPAAGDLGDNMRTFVVGFATCVVLAIAGAGGYSYSGMQNIAAAVPDNPVVAWLLHNTYDNSLDRAAAGVTVPANLETPEAVRAGARLYNDECIYCHGAPGEEMTGLAKGLNPPAPVLLAASRHNAPGETFWVVKNGVRMSAMPAWGKSYDDARIWSVAAFLHQKHGIPVADYKALTSGD